MKNEGFEFSIKQLRFILAIGIVLFSVFFIYNFIIVNTRGKLIDDSLNNLTDESFRGIVINKDYDKDNHNSSMIYFNNNTKVAVFGEFWSKIQIGDSIDKKKGETIITIFRDKKIYKLDNKDIINSLK